MEKVIEERIDTVNNHRTPPGYCRTKDIGLAPIDWTLGKMSDVITPIKRVVPKPDKPYWRLGIKSWAKGTFHTYIDEPETVGMDELYEVYENDLVVNITFAWEHAIAIANKDDQGLLVSHRFPTYEFKDGQVPDFYKAVISQQFFKDMLEHISPGGAGRNKVLNRKDFLNLPCYVPPLAEQEKISEILDHYDKIIKLCEAKVDAYKSMKKACLSKMFPQNESNVPEIRFPGFMEVWEQHKLSDLVERGSTFGVEKELPRVEYEDIISGTGKLNKDIYTKVSNKAGLRFHAGDVLYGKLRPYLKNWLLPSFSGLAVGDFWVLQPQNIDSRFLYSLIQSDRFDEVANQSTGTKMPRADWNLVSKTEFAIPSSMKEQGQIGQFLLDLDDLITLHQREVEEYSKLKKAMTQLLLTGIVRIKT